MDEFVLQVLMYGAGICFIYMIYVLFKMAVEN